MSTKTKGITLLGLGPGDPGLLTRQAWIVIERASEIYLRTRHHPTIQGLPSSLVLHDFDDLYDQSASFEEVYAGIVSRVMALALRPEGVIYAVPGHPFVAEATSPEIARRAREEGIPLQVIEGLSFLEPVFSILGIDPFPRISMVDALDVARLHIPAFQPDVPALIAQIYSRHVAADVKLTLMEVYADDHPVRLVHNAGTDKVVVEDLPLYELDKSQHIGLQSVLYLPPLQQRTSFEAFQEVIAHLRAPEGCPWDREQTHLSLRPYLLEESYEVLSALDTQDIQGLKEELGDLMLQIVLHAQIAAEEGEFRMTDVLEYVNSKLVYRHPHVFGDTSVDGVENVLSNWEKLKAEERKNNGKENLSILNGVPSALPALVQAEQYQDRAARTGFQWSEMQHVLDKVREEIHEVQAAQSPDERAAEIGDLLFAVVNLARNYEIEPESSLREANLRFRRRFEFVETQVRESGQEFSAFNLSQLMEFWQQAKRNGM